jgi:tRNA threonylcarbamoyladenosine biosynthesis protein TsaE
VKKDVKSEVEMKALGARLGALLRGGESIELSGDVGAGKTTFVKGLAVGLAIDEDVQSPSFTVSRVYDARDGLQLAHYDFYRLQDAGIMANELDEVIRDDSVVTVVEWADIVEGVLPAERLRVQFTSPSEGDRTLEFTGLDKLTEQL